MGCTEFNLEWNPIGTAQAHSALAGVLAGLVFGGIVVLFSDRNQSQQRMRALMLFSGALVVLAFDSFLFGVVAGEQVCAKAWTATMQAGGLLGLGALGIFGGISWLFNTYDNRFQQATRLARHITYMVALIVGFHLQLNAKSYLFDMRAMELSDPPGWLVRTVDLYIWLIIVIIVAFPLLRWMAPRFQHWAAFGRSDAGEVPGEPVSQRLDRKVRTAAYLSVGYVVLVAGASGVMLGWTRGQWEPTTPTSVVASATLLSLAVPTLALVAQLLSLPPGVTTPDGTTDPVVPGSIPDHPDSGCASGTSAVDEQPAAKG